ncbi:MbtH family NRPS accessory protein [Dactylosporangium fulvum]|uniref:MbtH family NRPS accessory protein n=1 Tax=Dactylosporangium fulvum TaxID=53359 RepID=A0ABY5VNE8_9ACTN|nr:MbtH family NRPS accessory protein [Dactylosporangium fulvum]UWP79232.1 MbtH family NRPS accessory protein [Dactylosporangium fulvum]
MIDAFRVVRNDEEQYSIMPADMVNPFGWHDEGTVGSREACLDRIRQVWTDLRPRSLREATRARRG